MRQGFSRVVLAAVLAVAAGSAAAQAPQVVTYKTAGEQALSAHLFAPSDVAAEPRPAILMFHGGGWVAGEPAWTYPAATARTDAQLRRMGAHPCEGVAGVGQGVGGRRRLA